MVPYTLAWYAQAAYLFLDKWRGAADGRTQTARDLAKRSAATAAIAASAVAASAFAASVVAAANESGGAPMGKQLRRYERLPRAVLKRCGWGCNVAAALQRVG